MQVAAEPPALLLAGGDETLARPLEVGGEPHGIGGHPGLAGEVVEQAPVRGGETFFAGARAEQKLADGLVLVGERQAQGSIHRLARLRRGQVVARESDGGVG